MKKAKTISTFMMMFLLAASSVSAQAKTGLDLLDSVIEKGWMDDPEAVELLYAMETEVSAEGEEEISDKVYQAVKSQLETAYSGKGGNDIDYIILGLVGINEDGDYILAKYDREKSKDFSVAIYDEDALSELTHGETYVRFSPSTEDELKSGLKEALETWFKCRSNHVVEGVVETDALLINSNNEIAPNKLTILKDKEELLSFLQKYDSGKSIVNTAGICYLVACLCIIVIIVAVGEKFRSGKKEDA